LFSAFSTDKARVFDIGFSELVIISLIALIAIGPQRLPRVARTLGHLAGRMQRYVADVKADISREVEMEDLKKMRESVEQAAHSFESSVQGELSKAETDLNAAASAAAAEAPKAEEPPRIAEKAG
jgi:sec-independent protein translocase protein TatB